MRQVEPVQAAVTSMIRDPILEEVRFSNGRAVCTPMTSTTKTPLSKQYNREEPHSIDHSFSHSASHGPFACVADVRSALLFPSLSNVRLLRSSFFDKTFSHPFL